MKILSLIFSLAIIVTLQSSCKNVGPVSKSEPLSQIRAEHAAREFATMHGYEHADQMISGSTIQKYESVTAEPDGTTSMKVFFLAEGSTRPLGIIFIFGHTTPDQWAIKSIKPDGTASDELKQWLENKANINEPVK
ncbi:MAG: hypothetical protein ABJC12_06365 [Saprospiraceae bacterium]